MYKYFSISSIVVMTVMLLVLIFVPVDILKGEKIGEIDAGTVITIEEAVTSWNDLKRTRVETVNGIFHVRGVLSVMKGVEAKVERYQSGRSYLCLNDRKKCLRIIGKT